MCYTNLRTWPENNGSDIDARREYADDRKQLDEMVMSGETEDGVRFVGMRKTISTRKHTRRQVSGRRLRP